MQDPRDIATGRGIPSEGYCDQPYVVINEDGSWTVTLTTGAGREGQSGQHVVSAVSADQGRTWSELHDIEPADGPEASWVMPLKVPGSGRIYAFYTYNRDNMREVIADDPPYEGGMAGRVDSLGAYAYKCSDDNGRTWSSERWEIPMRPFSIDLRNPYGGDVRFFWGVGKPFIHDGAAYVMATKVGGFGKGFFTSSTGMLLRSDNLLTEPDPARRRWETLPDGGDGIHAPEGPINAEHNVTPMGDGSLYCTYRTIQGHSGHAYSRDGGHTWTAPEFMTYSPGGRCVKNPRAANFVRRFSNGKYIYWYENHGLRTYDGRNPAWLCGGIEKDGFIHWSQPEVVLYERSPGIRISYPDFIEQDGRYFITQTQKTVARVCEIDPALLEGMWRQGEDKDVARDGLAVDMDGAAWTPGCTVQMPSLRGALGEKGLACDFWVRFDDLAAGQTIFDARDASGRGVAITLTDRATVRISLSGNVMSAPCMNEGCGQCESSWDCDPGLLKSGALHHVAVVVDAGPKTITFIVDGVLCDGGSARPFGWGRFHPGLALVAWATQARVGPALNGALERLRFYTRYLRTSEAVANYHAGP